jgi:formamidopyrimidine-DNA glycosylase
MPELPEVEVIRRDLEKEVTGRRIRSAEVRNTKNAMRIIRRHSRRLQFEEVLAGAGISGVDRRGKYLLFYLDNGWILVAHLGMSGQLLICEESEQMANHTHVVLDFVEDGQLRYVDPRSFGEMFVTPASEFGEIKELQKLGIDPLEQTLTWQFFSESLMKRKSKLKSLLMDQAFVCGIGNIYSDEILYAAGLRYDRTSETLAPSEVRRLYRAIQEVLQESIRNRGTSMEDEQYRDLYGSVGGFQNLLNVYQREGQSCHRCRNPIERARWSNRSTYYCSHCQS